MVPAPGPGDLDVIAVFLLIDELKRSEQAKSACGGRVIAWYEDLARGLAK